LGAGSTALLALIWLSDPEIMKHGFQAYSLAPPLSFSDEFNPYLKPYLMSCVLGNDIVPRMCFGTIRDVVAVLTAFREMDRTKR
jgi:hypothetical protein